MVGTCMAATTPRGATCEDPIEIDGNVYTKSLAAGEYWFSAWTYDLPTKVSLLVKDTTGMCTPHVEVDFSCTGIYDDPRLTELFDKSTGSYADLPFVLTCDSVNNAETRTYTLDIGDRYRTLLVQAGITENLRALVHVTLPKSGFATITPDVEGGTCLRNSHMVSLGDTLHIDANDSTTTFTLPLSGWKHDSVRFVWFGQQHDLHADMAIKYCDFSSTPADSAVNERFAVEAMDSKKFTAKDIDSLVSKYTFGGNVYYAHFISEEAGELVVEKVPTTPAAGGAQTLRLGRATQLPLGDTAVYCFYKTWGGTTFSTPTDHIFRMYIGVSPAIDTADAGSYLAKYQFGRDAYGAHRLDLSSKEMKALTDSARDNYLYVRFFCSEATSILPSTLDNDCVNGSNGEIVSGQATAIRKNNQKTAYYRLFYPEWRRDSISIQWRGNQDIYLCLDNRCQFTPNADRSHIDYLRIAKNSTKQIDTAYIHKYWDTYVTDTTGYIYIRYAYESSAKMADGQLTFTKLHHQTEVDPEPQDYEVLTVRLHCDEVLPSGAYTYTVQVTRPQTVSLTMDDGSEEGYPIGTWYQEPRDTHTLPTTLLTGTYTLTGSASPTHPITFQIP